MQLVSHIFIALQVYPVIDKMFVVGLLRSALRVRVCKEYRK